MPYNLLTDYARGIKQQIDDRYEIATADASEAIEYMYNQNQEKHLFSIGFSIGKTRSPISFPFALHIDMADMMEVTPEGKAGYVTLYATGGVAAGVSFVNPVAEFQNILRVLPSATSTEVSRPEIEFKTDASIYSFDYDEEDSIFDGIYGKSFDLSLPEVWPYENPAPPGFNSTPGLNVFEVGVSAMFEMDRAKVFDAFTFDSIDVSGLTAANNIRSLLFDNLVELGRSFLFRTRSDERPVPIRPPQKDSDGYFLPYYDEKEGTAFPEWPHSHRFNNNVQKRAEDIWPDKTLKENEGIAVRHKFSDTDSVDWFKVYVGSSGTLEIKTEYIERLDPNPVGLPQWERGTNLGKKIERIDVEIGGPVYFSVDDYLDLDPDSYLTVETTVYFLPRQDEEEPAEPVGGTVLGVNGSGDISFVDLATGRLGAVASTGRQLNDIDMRSDGAIFGVAGSTLYRVDGTTGALTSVGALGINANALEIADDGTGYAVTGGAGGVLVEVDTTTGAATRLGPVGWGAEGDLQFVGDQLFLSASGGQLVRVDVDNPAASVAVGPFGVGQGLWGLALSEDGRLVGFGDKGGIFAIDTASGKATRTAEAATSFYGAAVYEGEEEEPGAEPPITFELANTVWNVGGVDALGTDWTGSLLVITGQTVADDRILLAGYYDWVNQDGPRGREYVEGYVLEDGTLQLDGTRLENADGRLALGRYPGVLLGDGTKISGGTSFGEGEPVTSWEATLVEGAEPPADGDPEPVAPPEDEADDPGDAPDTGSRPVVTAGGQSLAVGAFARVADWVSVSDPDGGTPAFYGVYDYDGAAGTGYFRGDGYLEDDSLLADQPFPAGQRVRLTPEQFAGLEYGGATAPGTEAVGVIAYDDVDWGEWAVFDALVA